MELGRRNCKKPWQSAPAEQPIPFGESTSSVGTSKIWDTV